ncbi:hypothetical protein ACOKFD_08840 [Flagellimonas sp. S174]|uniref:hypothetical protein n=1 Tax=Flagellimonas sp. S174 TaxID=3410790 RepID=UPI003BF5F9D3
MRSILNIEIQQKSLVLLCICLTSWMTANSQEEINFEFLNGNWLQACDSIVTGNSKGTIECSPEMWTQISFILQKNKGTMIREDFIIKEKDTSHIIFEKIGSELYMIGSTINKPWLHKVHKMKKDSLGLYSNNNTTITFYVKQY